MTKLGPKAERLREMRERTASKVQDEAKKAVRKIGDKTRAKVIGRVQTFKLSGRER
jgi:hypothetical protein